MIHSRGFPTPSDVVDSTQDARTVQGKQREQRGDFIPIDRDRLAELHASQVRLETYIRGYVTLREQASTCRNVAGLLARAKRERKRLSDDFYRDVLTDEMRNLRLLTHALDPILSIAADDSARMSEGVTRHDSQLDMARDAIRALTNPSQEADAGAILDTIAGSIHELIGLVDDISVDCERHAQKHLQRLGEVIASIFAIDESRRMAIGGQATPVRRKRLTDRGTHVGAERGQVAKAEQRESPGDMQSGVSSKSGTMQEGWRWRSSLRSPGGNPSPQPDRNPPLKS